MDLLPASAPQASAESPAAKPWVQVFIATSLDGYIARTDGSLDWLDAANATVPTGEDCGYAEFMVEIDALVMGRNTYDKVLTFGFWPYGEKRVFVLSSRDVPIAPELRDRVSVERGEPAELVERLSASGFVRIYLDGGKTIQRFLAADCVDELTLTTIPVLLGSGISLFGRGEADLRLQLVASRSWTFGFVQSRWRVER